MQEHSRRERDWEHWPGRRPPLDDGIRHRLKALFASTGDEEAVEALIAERSREIEEQTERLEAAIVELERREEQAARLRSAVEEMLCQGSAELDERHAELAALAVDLRAREEKVREQERDLTVRTQELGAVELRRAAVERKEEALAEREAEFERVAAELAAVPPPSARVIGEIGVSRAQGAEGSLAEPETSGHLLHVADGGYRFLEHEGLVPELDAPLELDGRSYVVVRIGRSMLPGDRRACVYLEPSRGSAPA